MRALGSFLALAVVATTGCPPPTPPPPPRPLHVAVDLWPGYYPLILAQERGYLREEGVEVEIVIPQDTDAMLSDFAAGSYDAVAVALGDVINVTQRNPEICVVLVSDESAGGDALVGREPLTDPTDLSGMRIGTNLGGFGEVFVREFLRRRQVAPTDVELLHVDAAQVPTLLSEGKLDAAHTWQPYVSQAVDAGHSVWFSSADTPGLIPDTFAFQAKVLREREPEVRAFLRAWFRAVADWQDDFEGGRAAIAKRLDVAPETITLEGIRLLDRQQNARAFDPDARGSLHAVTQRYVDFFLERGYLSQPVDPATLLREPARLYLRDS